MPQRPSNIPQYLERSTLQTIKRLGWVRRTALHPAGDGTVATLLKKGWIEQQVGPSGQRQFRITEAGKLAVAAKIPTTTNTKRFP